MIKFKISEFSVESCGAGHKWVKLFFVNVFFNLKTIQKSVYKGDKFIFRVFRVTAWISKFLSNRRRYLCFFVWQIDVYGIAEFNVRNVSDEAEVADKVIIAGAWQEWVLFRKVRLASKMNPYVTGRFSRGYRRILWKWDRRVENKKYIF